MDAALAENLPRSLTLRTGSPPDGLRLKDRVSLRTGVTGYGWAAGANTLPCPRDGFDWFKEFLLTQGRGQLWSFRRQSGMSCLRPPTLSVRSPLRLETSKAIRARNERANRYGLSSRNSETRIRSLDPLIRVLTGIRVTSCHGYNRFKNTKIWIEFWRQIPPLPLTPSEEPARIILTMHEDELS